MTSSVQRVCTAPRTPTHSSTDIMADDLLNQQDQYAVKILEFHNRRILKGRQNPGGVYASVSR